VGHVDLESVIASGRSVATAAVSAAADVAIGILAEGGNAFDAAVAACLVETVWLPMKCGLAGDVVALCRCDGGPFRALVSVGPGGAGFAPGQLTLTGPRSIGVPGAPDGYAALAKLGRLSLKKIIAPARNMALTGVTWLPVAVSLTAESRERLRMYNDAVRFLPNWDLPTVGSKLRLPGLAGLLDAFAQLGSRLFWGDIATPLLERVRVGGGLLTAEDLRVNPAQWTEPTRRVFPPEYEVLVTPYPTHGPRLLRTLELVRCEGLRDLDAVIRAITEDKNAGIDGDGTSVVSAADDAGNAVVVVHSNSFPQYGSGVVVSEYDLVLNNRAGRGFAVNDHVGENAPAPGRVPRTTLHAWARTDGAGVFIGATPGGINQTTWNAQTILATFSTTCDLAQLVLMPRWAFDSHGESIAEDGHLYAGAAAKRIPYLGLRSATQILRLEHGGMNWAIADPRIGAVARAF
jgi:gamma-glutamyltranspeptidase/glutathione hydrolase